MISRIIAALLAAVMLSGCGTAERYDKPEENTPSETAAESVSLPSSDEQEKTPIYDNTAVVNAYKSGSSDGLNDKDAAILEELKKVIPEFYTEGMSEAAIAIAAHDWIVTHLVYDQGELLAIPQKTPDTENPYGALILRQGICMGYTTLFQLFMDVLGVKSQIITGDGMGINDWEEHAWNLVEIDGKYYHCDTTWDDFVPDEEGRMPFHMYALVPDGAMDVLHRWDHSAWPKADSEDLLYYESAGLVAENKEEIMAIQTAAYESGERYCEIMTRDDTVAFQNFTTYYWVVELGDYYVTVYWLY